MQPVQDMETHLFGNPHSQHGWSGNEGSAQAVAEARQLTLQMCNAPLGEYECVFTSGATGALDSSFLAFQHALSTMHCPLSTICCLLSTVYHLVFAVYCPLSTI